MRTRRIIVVAIIVIAALGVRLATREPEVSHSPPSPHVPEAPAEPTPPAEESPLPAPVAPPPAIPTPPPVESRVADRRDLENPLVQSYPPSTPPPRRAADADPEVATAFDRISLMFRAYRDLGDGNPVGTNAEIMKAIMGDNPKGAHLGPPEGQTLNDNGELLDPWGTPYFFHQLSKDLMEIRSAGPDRRMWNNDDFTGN